MKDFFNSCKPLFDTHKNGDHVEVEMRLGKMNGTMFDTNVGKDSFEKILKSLKKYNGWESVKESTTSVYYKGSTRVTIDEDTENSVTVDKRKVGVVDHRLANQPFDIRFCVSKELPAEMGEDDVMDHVRHKTRTSFVRKNLSIDMTVVTGEPDDMDDEAEETYEVELEIINPKLITDDDRFYNLIYKIDCIMKLLK
jgi:hypothetical protein